MTQWTIEADLTLDAPLHVGVGKGGDVTDAPVRRNGRGETVIPGRALGGSLRTLATRIAPYFFPEGECEALSGEANDNTSICTCVVCQLFGTVRLSNDANAGHASSLWVYDATATTDSYVRDGVGINRKTGAAARNVKYDYELVPSKTVFKVQMRLQPLPMFLENADAIAQMQQLLMLALSEWQAGRGQLGGGVARGMGRFTLTNLIVQTLSINSADSLIDYLSDDSTEVAYKPVTDTWQTLAQSATPVAYEGVETLPAAHGFASVKFDLRFADLFLINDPLTAFLSGFDHAPLVSFLQPADQAPVLPVLSGASLRGALRSHAEKIGRTLAMHYAAGDGKRFLEICPAPDPFAVKGDPLLAWHRKQYFADDEGERAKLPDESPPSDFHLSEQLFGNQLLGSRLWIKDAAYVGHATGKSWTAQDFLAIDPFTGGGRDGAKFDAAPLTNARFHCELLLHNPADWELGWLVLTLRDVADKMVTFGFGAAKGYGVPTVENVRWQVADVLLPSNRLGIELTKDNSTADGVYNRVDANGDGILPSKWRDAASGWVAAFNQMIQSPTWERLESDSYFGTPLEGLYSQATVEVSA